MISGWMGLRDNWPDCFCCSKAQTLLEYIEMPSYRYAVTNPHISDPLVYLIRYFW